MRHPEALSDLEIRQEARFVLWALRWCALAHQGDSERAWGEIGRGFELADVSETAVSFWAFARCLCESAPGLVWHGPACGCVSSGEMHVLHALAQVAERQRAEDPLPSRWWQVLVSEPRGGTLDDLARRWLAQLHRAGIQYPGATELVEAMTPLHSLADEFPAQRMAYN